MASRAWNAIDSLAPLAREQEAWALYRLKNSGYQAMVAGDWIRAYYIFRELSEKTPSDPDVINYLAKSEEGTVKTAFFTDEMNLSFGELLTDAVFSLPAGAPGDTPGSAAAGGEYGRAALRFSSLAAYPDYSYGTDLEYLAVYPGGGVSRVEAPYAKILPISLDERPCTLILLQALDRGDPGKRWTPVWTGEVPADPAEGTRLILELSYENFLLLIRVGRSFDNLFAGELWSAAAGLEPFGYIPESFQAGIIKRLGRPLFFLPLAILVLVLGWRYRARKRPRYLFIPMLAVLPMVFYGLVRFCESALDDLGTLAVIYLGFTPALAVFTGGIAVFFVLSLILLAAQRS
jgi:hypothetical protein